MPDRVLPGDRDRGRQSALDRLGNRLRDGRSAIGIAFRKSGTGRASQTTGSVSAKR